jgi:hypothetical protein
MQTGPTVRACPRLLRSHWSRVLRSRSPPSLSLSLALRGGRTALARAAVVLNSLHSRGTISGARKPHACAGMYHVFPPGHSSREEAWKARPGLHYMCQPSGQGCKRMLQFAGPAHGDYSAIGGGMGFGKVKVNGHEVTTYTHTQTHACIHTHACMHACMYVYACVCIRGAV